MGRKPKFESIQSEEAQGPIESEQEEFEEYGDEEGGPEEYDEEEFE